MRRVRFAWRVTKATHTRSLQQFPRQQWLRERASVLSYVRTLTVLSWVLTSR